MTSIKIRLAAPILCASLILAAGCQTGYQEATSLILTEEELHSPPTLNVGDPAPPVVVSEWLRGDPTPAPQPGKICVLDFWAGWCGPCKAVMPRLSALQAKHPEILVIGLTALDERNTRGRVNRGLSEVGDAVKIRLALDGGPQGDSTVAAYMNAGRETGIPCTFVINREGRIAWIGHPKDADPVVEAVIAGTWDVAAAAKERSRAAEDRIKGRALYDAWKVANENKDRSAEMAALDAACAMSPESIGLSPPFFLTARRIDLLRESGETEAARQAFTAAIAHPDFADDPWALAEFGKGLRLTWIEQTDPNARRAEELAVARRASNPTDSWDAYMKDALTDWDAEAFNLLARYWYSRGDREKAIGLLRKAVELTDPIYELQRNERVQLLKKYEAEATTSQ